MSKFSFIFKMNDEKTLQISCKCGQLIYLNILKWGDSHFLWRGFEIFSDNTHTKIWLQLFYLYKNTYFHKDAIWLSQVHYVIMFKFTVKKCKPSQFAVGYLKVTYLCPFIRNIIHIANYWSKTYFLITILWRHNFWNYKPKKRLTEKEDFVGKKKRNALCYVTNIKKY